MSSELFVTPQHPPRISGELLVPFLNALGVPLKRTMKTTVGPDWAEVTYALTDENGHKYRAGNEVASITVRVGVDWSFLG
jgi:hypothetical protein